MSALDHRHVTNSNNWPIEHPHIIPCGMDYETVQASYSHFLEMASFESAPGSAPFRRREEGSTWDGWVEPS